MTRLALAAIGLLVMALPAHSMDKQACTAIGANVIESGITSWWFCCSEEACLSCTGETQNSCQADTPIAWRDDSYPLAKESPATIDVVIPTKRRVSVPKKIWEMVAPE